MVDTQTRKPSASSGVNRLTLLPKGWNALFLVILIVGAVVVVVPMALVVIVSFTSEASIANAGFSFFPQEWSTMAYQYLWKTGDQLVDSYIATIFYTITGTLISLTCMTTYAYVIVQRNFIFHRALTWLLFFTMLFSGGLVPEYILKAQYLKINNTVWIFLLFQVVTAYNVIILRTFIRTTIPESLLEAARIDGAGHFTIFSRIVLPLLKAGIATVALFNIVTRWNDWFQGMLYIEKASLVPLQTMLIKLQDKIDFLKQNAAISGTPDGIALLRTLPDQNMRMACTVVIVLPILFAYPFFQRYFVSGLTIGSIKE